MLVKFSNVSKSFNTNIIVDNVSFEIIESSINMMVGPNGSGKSTIAKMIMGFINPDFGKIQINMEKKDIAYVPQKFTSIPHMPFRVIDFINSLSISENDLINISIISKQEYELLKNTQINNLSGGQLQKILLATSLLKYPKLIVLDEPTSNLDLNSTNNFYNIIDDIRKNFKTSVFMISHDVHVVMKNADQILCLNNHICCKGKPYKKDILENSNMTLFYHDHDHNHNHDYQNF